MKGFFVTKTTSMQSGSYRLPDPVYDVVSKIVNEVRINHNYDTAAKIAIDNNISLNQMISKTLKLDVFDIAKLADAMKKLKSK